MTKPAKWHVRPAKTQISLGIRSVWSESSLFAWWKLRLLATHWAHSKTQIRLGGCPALSESSLGTKVSLLVLSRRAQLFSFRQWIEFHRDFFDTQNFLIAIYQLTTSLCNCSECHRRVNKSLNHQRRESFLLITFSVSPKPKSWKKKKKKQEMGRSLEAIIVWAKFAFPEEDIKLE